MKENKKKIEFLNDFIDNVEAKASSLGTRETPFFTEMLSFMELEDEPAIIFPYKKNNIKINGYFYDENLNSLSLFVVDYDIDFDENTLPEITKTNVTEIANKAKRFFTNANEIYHNSSEGVEFRDLAKFISDYKREISEVDIYVLTTKFYLTNKPVDISIPSVETVNIHIWDMDRVYLLSEAEQGIREFEVEFGQAVEMIRVPTGELSESNCDIDCYIGYIPAKLLAQLYDEWGPKLVERNVRSFLQARGGTNKGIRDTLKNVEEKELFVSYNNGISSVAKGGSIEQIGEANLWRINSLVSWQIVNGGQTTASIHQAYQSGIDLTNVYVQAKLTIINVVEGTEDSYTVEDNLVAKISEYANTQNKINKSDLLANTRFMSDIEKFSRNIWIPSADNRKQESKWYFERARGQYMVDIGRRKKGKEQNAFKKLYPKENVITKVELAKYFMSWEAKPHISSKGGEEAFKTFMNENAIYWKVTVDGNGNSVNPKSIDDTFYKQLIARKLIYNFVESVVNSLNLKGYRANVIYYTVSMLSYLYGEEIDLNEVWQNQKLDSKWESVVRNVATTTLNYLKESAGDQNVTQWAKKEECWNGYKKECKAILAELI